MRDWLVGLPPLPDLLWAHHTSASVEVGLDGGERSVTGILRFHIFFAELLWVIMDCLYIYIYDYICIEYIDIFS